MTVGERAKTTVDKAPVSRNNQQIHIVQTDRTFIVRYRYIPPLLFITETPNLLGRDFLSRFLLFFRYTSNKGDMTGLSVGTVSLVGHDEKRE